MGRQIPPAVGGGATTSAIECDERFPEGNGTMATLAEVHSDMNGAGKAASSTLRCALEFTVTLTLPAITFDHCQYASDVATCAFDPENGGSTDPTGRLEALWLLADIVRTIFGNPFRRRVSS